MKQLNNNTFGKNSWSRYKGKLCFLRNILRKILRVAIALKCKTMIIMFTWNLLTRLFKKGRSFWEFDLLTATHLVYNGLVVNIASTVRRLRGGDRWVLRRFCKISDGRCRLLLQRVKLINSLSLNRRRIIIDSSFQNWNILFAQKKKKKTWNIYVILFNIFNWISWPKNNINIVGLTPWLVAWIKLIC